MLKLEEIIKGLRAAESTPAIQLALSNAINLRASLAAAEADIKSQVSREVEGTLPTPEEQEKVNEPIVTAATPEATASAGEVKEEVKKTSGFLGLGNKS